MRLLIVVICLFLSSFALSAIEVEQVEAWSITHPSAQIEDFLDWVKIKDPSQLSWFTLMRKTESSQGATPTDPRAIVFGPTAKFIFTFNGAPTSKGYQEIEMIFFREIPQARWEMRKLSFSPQDKKNVFSGPNPPQCLSCHQNPVRPIWNQYDIWKGAYGENDDAIPDFNNDKYAGGGISEEQLIVRKKEWLDFREFLKNKDSHSRYGKLEFAEGSPVSPYSPSGRNFNYRLRPNLKLTESLMSLHSKTLISKLKEHPEFNKEKRLLLASLLRCEDHIDPKNIAEQNIFTELEARFLKCDKGTVPWNHKGYTGDMSHRHYLLYLLGLEHSDFSLERRPTKWSYFGGELYSEENLMLDLYAFIKKEDPRLSAFHYYDQYSREMTLPEGATEDLKTVPELCVELLQSRLGQGGTAASGPISLKNSFATCVGCHHKNGEAPYLPFEDPDRLKDDKTLIELIKNRIGTADPSLRMPPLRTLSEKERQGIYDWLFSLLNSSVSKGTTSNRSATMP